MAGNIEWVTIAEIARRLDATPQHLTNLRARTDPRTFPKPNPRVTGALVYRWDEFEKYWSERYVDYEIQGPYIHGRRQNR